MTAASVPRIATAMITLALAGVVAAPAQAAPSAPAGQARLKQAAASCPSGDICLWREKNYNGVPWRWSPSDGTRALPSNMRDHVYSFYASASGCFIDTGGERRRVSPGHYAKVYNTNFGTKVDTIAPYC